MPRNPERMRAASRRFYYKDHEGSKARQRDRYAANRESEQERGRDSTRARRTRNRRFVRTYLEAHPCVDCGFSNLLALDFDHVRGTKDHNVSHMVGRAFSLDRIKAEIEKCEVRCANCHRIKTEEYFAYYRDRGLSCPPRAERGRGDPGWEKSSPE